MVFLFIFLNLHIELLFFPDVTCNITKNKYYLAVQSLITELSIYVNCSLDDMYIVKCQCMPLYTQECCRTQALPLTRTHFVSYTFLLFFFPYKYITTWVKTFCPRIGCNCYCTVEFCYPAGTPVDIANGTFVLFINTWKVIFSSFQYHKEVVRLMSGEFRQKIGDKYISFARKWMNYVLTKCESGRGTRPR